MPGRPSTPPEMEPGAQPLPARAAPGGKVARRRARAGCPLTGLPPPVIFRHHVHAADEVGPELLQVVRLGQLPGHAGNHHLLHAAPCRATQSAPPPSRRLGSARSLATCSLAPASTCSANPANPAACRVSSGPAGPHFSLGPGSPHHSPAAGGLPSIWWPAAGSLGTPAISLRAGPVNRAAGGETAQRCEGRKPPPTDRPPRTRCPRLPPTAPCPNLGDPGGELGHHGCQGSALQRANLENLSWSGVRQVLPRATHLCR